MSGVEIFELPPRSVEVAASAAAGGRFLRTDEGPNVRERYFLYEEERGKLKLLGTARTRQAAAAHAPARDLRWETGDDRIRSLVADRREKFLIAYIEALFGSAPTALTAEEICKNATEWLSFLPPATRRELNFAIWLLEKLLKDNFADLPIPDRQRRIEERLDDYGGLLKDLGKLRTIFYASYFQDRQSWPSIGFVFPQDRPQAPAYSQVDELRMSELKRTDSCDWLVIGSGAGGAPAAAELAAAGADVLVIDRGSYWPVKSITHKDTEQYAKIYVAGGLQTSSDRDMAVLQGSAIGGSSLINNCICFRLDDPGWTHPDAADVLDHWKRSYRVDVDRQALEHAFDHLEQRLEVHEVADWQAGPNGLHLLDAWRKFLAGPHATAADRRAPFRRFKKNYGRGERKCWACGYCNSGCPYYRKNSVAQTLLHDAQKAGARLVPDAEATRINFPAGPTSGDVSARSVNVRYRGRSALVSVREGVVVAAGVGASSKLLVDSGFEQAGQRVACNLSCPVIARMPARMDSWNGLQMGAYVDRGTHLIESWFHPPATFCATVGGWFEEFMRRMSHYSDLVCFAAVMPVSNMGEIRDGAFEISLQGPDVLRLRSYVEDVVRLHFAGGADEVYLPSTDAMVVRPSDPISDIVRRRFNKAEDFIISTAHPQGGNPMGPRGKGVVGEDLHVYGTHNVFVADASIFPSSIRVNPQLAIMAFSHARFRGGVDL